MALHSKSPLILALLVSAAPYAVSQVPQGCCGQAYAAAELQISNAERSLAFYHDVLGLEYPPGWTSKLNAPSAAQAKLTGIPGLIRVVNLVIPGATWHMQLVETSGMERKAMNPRRQDIGATGFILYVRDLDRTLTALKKAEAPIVTTGGAPVTAGTGRAILAQDPDGFFIEVRQPQAVPPNAPAGNVIGARMSVSIADTDRTSAYWRNLLDFDVQPEASFRADRPELALHGTPGAQVRKSVATIRKGGQFDRPGTDVVFEFLEFKNIERRTLAPRYQDPGGGAFVLRLKTADASIRGKEMAAAVERLKASGQAKILTTGGEALDQGARFAVFTQDVNGFILEITQSVAESGKQ